MKNFKSQETDAVTSTHLQNDPNSETNGFRQKQSLIPNLRDKASKITWVVIWVICTATMLIFISQTFKEYAEDNPITIVTFVPQPKHPDPVMIELCHKIVFDEEKIIAYNGTEYDKKSINFLKQMVLQNDSFNHRDFILPSTFGDTFLLSPRIMDAFKLDLNQFLTTCIIFGSFRDCSQNFKFHLEFASSCYKAQIDLGGFGTSRALMLGFYFDPNHKFGKYSVDPGLSVAIHHPNDHLSPLEGFTLAARDHVIVTANVEHKLQHFSFEKAECAKKTTQEHNITGTQHSSNYHPRLCQELCFVKKLYLRCNCSFNYGINSGETVCLEQEGNRKCLRDAFFEWDIIESSGESCLSNCLPKCSKTELKTSVLKDRDRNSALKMKSLLEAVGMIPGQNISLAAKLVHKIQSSNESLKVAEQILPHTAELTLYFPKENQIKLFEVIPLMTFATFLSNVGGLVGMWLGLSAISVLELLGRQVSKLWNWKKRVGDEFSH